MVVKDTDAISVETVVRGTPRKTKTYCAECGARCGVVAHVEDGRLTAVTPDRNHPNRGFCVKGEAAPEKVYNAGRLLYPMRRTNPKTAAYPGWERISWTEALDEVAKRLLEIRAEHGPEAVAFTRPALMGSGSVDWANWLIRLSRAFGTPNFITTTHICQWARDTGSTHTYGTGLPAPDYEHASTIVIWGNNPAVTEVHNWRRIKEAKRRGARLVVIDPRRTDTAALADLWLSPLPGTDAALTLGLIRLFLEHELYAADFVRSWTNAPYLIDRATGRFLRGSDIEAGGDDTRFVVWDEAAERTTTFDPAQAPAADLRPSLSRPVQIRGDDGRTIDATPAFQMLREAVEPYTLEAVTAITGIPAAHVTAMAEMISGNLPICYYTHNGVEQHINTMQTNRALCILFSLTGCYDAPGGNVLFPPAPANNIDGIELLPPAAIQQRLAYKERPLGAPGVSAQAYTFYDAVLDGKPYKMRALVGFGGNMLMQNGDSVRGRAAFEALDFQVHVDLFESPSNRLADILLPASTCWESASLMTGFGGRPDTSTYFQYRPAIIEPVGEARPDIEIIFDLAVRLGLGEYFWDGNVESAFRHQLAPSGIALEELQARPGGMHVPVPTRYRKYAATTQEGTVAGFKTPTQRIEIYSERFAEHGYDPIPTFAGAAWQKQARSPGGEDFPLILTTGKVAAYLHSGGRGIPMLRRRYPEPFVELHPQTAGEYGVLNDAFVEVSTPRARLRARARITDRVIPGVIATQTGWWEACEELGLPAYDPFGPEGANLNYVVTNELIDPISGSVPGKSYCCAIRPLPDTDL